MVFQNHFRSQAILLDQLFYNSRNLILITLPEFSEERPVVLIGFTGQLMRIPPTAIRAFGANGLITMFGLDVGCAYG